MDSENTTAVNSQFLPGNTTIFTNDYTSSTDGLFTDIEGAILSSLVGVMLLFGLIANIITFVVIKRSSKLMESPFNIFVMSLCISDCLSAITSPLVLYRRTWGIHEYELPHIFCKLGLIMDAWTTFATIQHIMVFSILRLISLTRPHDIKKFTVKMAKIVVVAIWIETLLTGASINLTAVVVPYQPGRQSNACTISKSWFFLFRDHLRYGSIFLVFIPMLTVISCCIVLIGFLIRRTRRRNTRNDSTGNQERRSNSQENFAVVQLSLVISLFLVGYLPDTCYRWTIVSFKEAGRNLNPRLKWILLNSTYICLRVSECLNPIFYNLASSTMRKATKQFLGIKKAKSNRIKYRTQNSSQETQLNIIGNSQNMR